MNWYPCELHCHTYHSDGRMSKDELLMEAERMELSAIALTDHNTYSAWDEQDKQVIPGMEWTTYFGHICVLGKNALKVDWRRANQDNMDELMLDVHNAGGVCGIAHPFRIGDPVCTGCRWQYNVRDHHLIDYWEVWSLPDGPLLKTNHASVQRWTDLCDAGCKIAPVSGRDWHGPDREKRAAVTYLGMEGLFSADEAIRALRKRHTVVTMGPLPEISLKTQGNRYVPGDVVPYQRCSLEVKVDFSRRHAVWEGYQIEVETVCLIGEGGQILSKTPYVGDPVVQDVQPVDGWMRVELQGRLSGTECTLAIASPFYFEHRTLITAHAGAEKTEPNTLSSINRLLDTGADILEIDVQENSAGDLVLSHDHPEKDCATFEQCLQLVKHGSKIRLNCDMKRPGMVQKAMQIARTHAMGSRLVFTGSLSEEDQAFLSTTEAKVWLNREKCPLELPPEGIDVVNMPFWLVNARTLQTAADAQVGISAWTADCGLTIKRLLTQGVRNITTNRPEKAIALRKEIEDRNG